MDRLQYEVFGGDKAGNVYWGWRGIALDVVSDWQCILNTVTRR